MPASAPRLDPVDELLSLFAERGQEEYGESVTIEAHMFLTGQAAADAGLADHLVVAGLTHDVGHLVAGVDDEFGLHDHGPPGADWVRPRFGDRVAVPVGLHVEAKRWLCGAEPSYVDDLSPASQHTLRHQGGPMNHAERAVFEQIVGWIDAVTLRRLEDSLGKSTTRAVDRDHLLSIARGQAVRTS